MVHAGKELPMATLTAQEIIDRIIQGVGCQPLAQTVDTFKAGDPRAAVTAIGCTFAATFDVLQRAVGQGINLLITHEPTFWEHMDNTEAWAGDKLLAAKKQFLADHDLVVWRCHDYWHKRRPDGILEGMVRALGWQSYQRSDGLGFFTLPPTTLGELAGVIQKKLGAKVVRVTGKAEMPCQNIAMLPGAHGPVGQIRALQREDVDVLVAGETREWETNEYVRDAVAAGFRKGLILPGHCNSEEAGMEFMADWLRQLVPQVRVEFLPAGDPFWSPQV